MRCTPPDGAPGPGRSDPPQNRSIGGGFKVNRMFRATGLSILAAFLIPVPPVTTFAAFSPPTDRVPSVGMEAAEFMPDADVTADVTLEAEADAPTIASAGNRLLNGDVLRLIQATNWRSSEWGVLAVSLDRGDTLVSMEADRPLAPASNQKLFTSAAALQYLGPDFRFPTYLLPDGTVEDGVLSGNLVL